MKKSNPPGWNKYEYGVDLFCFLGKRSGHERIGGFEGLSSQLLCVLLSLVNKRLYGVTQDSTIDLMFGYEKQVACEPLALTPNINSSL